VLWGLKRYQQGGWPGLAWCPRIASFVWTLTWVREGPNASARLAQKKGEPGAPGSSLAAIPVVLGVLGGEGAAAKGVIDIANGSGAIDNKTGENGKQGIDIATNPASGAALVAGASPQTAQNIGNIANVAMGARDLTERPKGLLDSISKASSVNDIYQSVRELVKQVIASPCSGCESIAP